MLKVAARSVERPAIETAWAREQLGAPGSRVLDTGSGTGARAIALARAGFSVAAWESSPDAIAAARREAESEGVTVDWSVADPWRPWTWPHADAGTVICSDWLADDAETVRVLRRLRQHLPAGVRLLAAVPCRDSKGIEKLLIEIRRAGFLIEGHTRPIGSAAASEGAGVLVRATALAAPPRSLAVTAWGADESVPVRLDMRYAPDEAPLLHPTPAEMWEAAEDAGAGDRGSHYAVDDPFGSRRGTPVVARFFGCDLDESQVTFAAGVTSMLHALSTLADGGTIASDPLVHGDLESWALLRGAIVRVIPRAVAFSEMPDVLADDPPSVFHFDRPTFTGLVADPGDIQRIADTLARRDGVVVIDESALPYLGPAASAVRLVDRVPNLIVLRGFTKAYSWGGLRAGYAVTSKEISAQVREVVPPLQISENTLHIVLRMLEAGDVFWRLRERIHQVKPAAAAALARAGFRVHAGHPDLPWVALDDPLGTSTRQLLKRGIRPLAPASHPAVRDRTDVIRVTVPLSEARFNLFLELLES